MNKNKCLICSIAAKQEKSFIVFEDEDFISFLDIKPLFVGHCLLTPKNHITTFYDLPDHQLKNYFLLAQKIGKAIELSMAAKGSFVAINNTVSQSIPHLHTHLVPRNPKDGLKGFFWPRTHYENEQHMIEIQLKIKNQIG